MTKEELIEKLKAGHPFEYANRCNIWLTATKYIGMTSTDEVVFEDVLNGVNWRCVSSIRLKTRKMWVQAFRCKLDSPRVTRVSFASETKEEAIRCATDPAYNTNVLLGEPQQIEVPYD